MPYIECISFLKIVIVFPYHCFTCIQFGPLGSISDISGSFSRGGGRCTNQADDPVDWTGRSGACELQDAL